MLKRISPRVRMLLLQLLLLLVLYSSSRLVFTLLNRNYFADIGIGDFITAALYGLRFDISIICILNILYVVLLFMPFGQERLQWWKRFMFWLFVIVNGAAMLFEMSDWAYYSFTLKRSTADVLFMITRKGDFWALLPHFIVDYWYAALGAILAISILIAGNRWIVRRYPLDIIYYNEEKSVSARIITLLLMTGIAIIGIRGGLQSTPINRASALRGDGKYTSVILNTPYSIVSTLSSRAIPEYDFYTEKELHDYINPVKHYQGAASNKKNVVIIILESFSRQFTGMSGRRSFTPFLDSLMQQSFVCRNAYANALHSAEGIPAIIAGIPSLMEEPITTSQYSINKISAMPGLLKNFGYSSAFYHGGTNGTMNFDQFCRNAGYDRYYGRTEYDNEKDYDGNWGIWDEPYLQYFDKGLKKMQQPFFTTVFTLSSHDPFQVPDKYEDVLPKGALKIHKSIAYTDMALRKFFQTAANSPYFNNTLFVITADHCSLMTEDDNDHNNMGFYRIPLFFYAPGDKSMKGGTDKLMQHVDILPSVLDYVGYDLPFFAFGNSIFREADKRVVINELNNSYQYTDGTYIMKTAEMELTQIYNYKADSRCWNNLIDEPEGKAVRKALEPYFQAYVQLYHDVLVHDKMCAE